MAKDSLKKCPLSLCVHVILRVIILNRGSMALLPVKKIFPAVKLRPQTSHIDKREIGDAAIPGEIKIHTSPSAPPPPPPQLGPLANERAASTDVTTSRYDVAHFGRAELHHFLLVLLRSMLSLFSIMTLWVHNNKESIIRIFIQYIIVTILSVYIFNINY